MGTYFNEYRGSINGKPYLILTDPTSDISRIYDEKSASKAGLQALTNTEIIEINNKIKESESEDGIVNKILDVIRGKEKIPMYAVAKYSGDTGQVLCTLMDNPISDSLFGNITHDKLFFARCLLNGVDMAIMHSEESFTIALRRDIDPAVPHS